MLVKEIIYMVLDLAKASTSDDSFFNEDHVLFLLKKYRSFLIKKEQESKKLSTDTVSEFECQEICLDLEKVAAIDGSPCSGGYYLKSVKKVPKILDCSKPRLYPIDFYQGINISYIPRDRMRYIGTNKFLQNIIYVSLGPDLHLYLKSNNPQFLYLKKLRMSAVFEDFDSITDYLCNDEGESIVCDILDIEFPIRENLVPSLIELVVKELTAGKYQPSDVQNNANDDLSDIASFVRRYMKDSMQQQMGV